MFDFFSLPNAKRLTIKAFFEVTLVSLTIKAFFEVTLVSLTLRVRTVSKCLKKRRQIRQIQKFGFLPKI